MGWQDLIASEGDRVLPWLGGRLIYNGDRSWLIQGRQPVEFGWYTFNTSNGRRAQMIGQADINYDYEGSHAVVRGLLIGDRLILDTARVEADPNRLIEQTQRVFCTERGIEPFTRIVAVRDVTGRLVYMRTEFPEGPECDVLAAYHDRKSSLDDIPGVTPPMDLAFRWLSHQREVTEVRTAERELQLEKEATGRRLLEQGGTAAGRRIMANADFNAAAKSALAIGDAEFLDARDGHVKGEKIVQYRFQHRRLECVCDALTLRIIDAGVCLEDHRDGVKGDTWFTLESLPTVIAEAVDRNKLVVYRGDDW